jgi:hypothetical protein
LIAPYDSVMDEPQLNYMIYENYDLKKKHVEKEFPEENTYNRHT